MLVLHCPSHRLPLPDRRRRAREFRHTMGRDSHSLRYQRRERPSSGGELLPRCENCWAYFNTYCELDQWSWNCALCGNPQGLSSEAIARYSHPQSCPEMMSSFVDLELPVEESNEAMQPRFVKNRILLWTSAV